MKVLITGGCGFIGSNLTEFLLNQTDWEINILDDLSNGSLENIQSLENYKGRVQFFKGSILNDKDIALAINECDYVINLAAQTSVLNSIKNPLEDLRHNVFGLLQLLLKSKDSGVKKLIQASSGAALGDQAMPIHELKIPQPISPYGASKLAGEGYCSVFSETYDLKCVVLRFSNVYGPRSQYKSSVIAKFIKKFLNHELLEIYGDGNQTRDFIHVRDICRGIYESLVQDTGKYNLFQLGSGKETILNDMLHILVEIARKNDIEIPEIKNVDPKPGEILRNYADISKASKKLGFSCEIDLKQGLKETLKWFIA